MKVGYDSNLIYKDTNDQWWGLYDYRAYPLYISGMTYKVRYTITCKNRNRSSYEGSIVPVDELKEKKLEADKQVAQVRAEKEATEAAKKAEQAAKKAEQERIAAEKRAREEAANKYDPKDFILVPSNFKPANFEDIDLFDAVVAFEKMGYQRYPTSDNYSSTVIFVRQSGTSLTFRTEDNSISQTMRIESRAALSPNQKVKIYYRVGNVVGWTIIAIKKA
jgi:hypothetical protein